VLVVHGLQDRVVPLAHARQVADGLGVAQPRWLDRCGHFPQVEHASAVNAYLTEFLYAPASR
jgi:2-hydroxymuconate-semialdehyde hydrolase